MLRFKPIQTYIAQKASAYLSKELHTTISLKGLYIVPFKSVVIEELLVLDLQKDTLAQLPELKININKLSLNERILDVKKLEINKGQFFLKDLPDRSTNLDFIIDYFDKPRTKPKPKIKKKKFELLAKQLVLNDFKFRYKNLRSQYTSRGINYDDLSVEHLFADFQNISNKDNLIETNIKSLSLIEKSGFKLNKLSGYTTVTNNSIEVKNLEILTDRTSITNYYRMDFKTFRDFKDYENKVKMSANFKNSHVSSYDIAFFAPALKKMRLAISLDGKVTGPVNDLNAKSLLIKAGKATYIKGDFSMKGLPHWNDTFMDMKIEMAGTNKKDLDELLTDISGKQVKKTPEIISKFGNINFKGYFTGFQNDFIAYGEFKTKLGQLKSDVNMKIDKNEIPSYSGSVKTYDFNIGQLLDQKLFGKVSSSLSIKGRGDKINELKEELDGQISYLDFKGYRYTNINLKGLLEKKYFDGALKIRDKNIHLDFDGTVNFNPQLPVFQFSANLKNAQLQTLNLYKDSLNVDAVFKTNFTGKNLNDINGQLLLAHIKLTNSHNSYHIDSVSLKASGTGLERSLKINSDILEASIHGQYDLNSISSYFKNIAKTYIPSLQTKIYDYKTQIFDFQLKIKNFVPLASFISPGLEIDNGSMLAGTFNSKNNAATLGGLIKRIKYKGIIANNIIIDQNTSEKQLTAIISSDKIDLNDSLFIKNINISNIVRNDSLALNIKLSDVSDDNQLDLNGLIEFFPDTSKISILPSNLRINKEDWIIQDKALLGFNEGKTSINHFSLKQGKQQIKLDGIISNQAEDAITLAIENFNLNNINPLVKTLGINLNGTANGTTNIHSVLKSPLVKNNITLDSLTLNNIHIGTLSDTSSYNSTNKKARIFTQILTNNKKTLLAQGLVDVKNEQLDIQLDLKDTKLVILSPFLSKLVSNLKGDVSADLSMSGSFKNPSIVGDISIKKSQVTVNYLKTTYLIDDKVKVKNASIQLDNLVLKDLEGHTAIANGEVDLKNINNPDIDVRVDANGIMALNTTAKDNSLYYGKAYGTGIFSFKGPTNDMFIDIDAKTEKGTVFNLPLNSSDKISEKEFITFVNHKNSSPVIKKTTSFKGLSMNFKLKVDPNTTANIYTILGKLTGTGNAELELNISKVGDFEMKGDYLIENGAFDFTAREVINKRFDIKQGGTIRWTGNPFNAQINLKAIYGIRIPLTDLYKAANKDGGSNASQSVQTEVEMGLSGLLLKPDIKLDILFPANPYIKDELQNYFNDGNNLNKQALSLVIQRRFTTGAGTENLSDQLSSAGIGTASDLFFNQLNNVLSALNLNFVDINIRSANEASASFKLFKDRIIVNAGITDVNKSVIESGGAALRNEVGRELEILALIKKDGSLIGKIANKPPTIQSIFANPGIDPYQNIFSFGVIYNQQFDSFREFLNKISGREKRKEKEKAKNIQNNQAITNNKKTNAKK